MTKVYYSQNDQEWSHDKLSHMLRSLPEYMCLKILAYQTWQERQSRIIGKHLLLKQIQHFNLDLTLADLLYSPANKPYFDTPFDFSIAHSGDIVICAATTHSPIGIDIEQICPIEIEYYQDYLSSNEWNLIHHSADTEKTFYKIWTKKEALLKAIGRGVDIDLNTIDASGDTITFESISYALIPLSIAQGYVAHLAISAPFDSASISFEMLSVLP